MTWTKITEDPKTWPEVDVPHYFALQDKDRKGFHHVTGNLVKHYSREGAYYVNCDFPVDDGLGAVLPGQSIGDFNGYSCFGVAVAWCPLPEDYKDE